MEEQGHSYKRYDRDYGAKVSCPGGLKTPPSPTHNNNNNKKQHFAILHATRDFFLSFSLFETFFRVSRLI